MATAKSDPIIVGIGASAGGLASLREFFNAMPPDSGLAFVVVQHLDPTHKSYMADILGKYSEMSVSATEDGIAVEPNCVYTIPPNKFLFVKDNRLHLTEPIKRDNLRMPIDFFLRSLAAGRGEKAIAVLLSGAGSDGTLGIREIHGAGGLVLVQDPVTAQFDSMLQSALASGIVDAALPVNKIATTIVGYTRGPAPPVERTIPSETVGEDISAIMDLLASQANSDFHAYRTGTLWRRIRRRMGLHRISNVSDYTRLLRQNSEELAKLAKDLLITVTSFFRDSDAFAELAAQAISPLVEQKQDKTPLRAWVVGCSTGEEAYSIAILIREEMLRQKKNFPLQIFASDVGTDSMKQAREGLYPESIASDVSEERLERFFIKKDSFYQISKEIRDSVTFAMHNVLMDPPFLRMDLISCRNLLIYIENQMQRRMRALFAFALKPGGYLFLGKSESVELDEVFQPVSRRFRIYRRLPTRAVEAGSLASRAGIASASHVRTERQPPALHLTQLNQAVLLKHFQAAIVLIDEQGKSLHFFGPINRYLELPSGEVTANLFDLVDKKHSAKLRLAVRKAFEESQTVTLPGLNFDREDSGGLIDVTVSCHVEPRSHARLAAVIFEEKSDSPSQKPAHAAAESPEQASYNAQLEAENKSLKDELQTNVESFQTTYEEFTSANEELVTMNEELQSTNEELETAKEELQSVNEELLTVNNQINEKMTELGHTNDDLANFLNSSEVSTIFLDSSFRLRRYTPVTQNLLSLLQVDIGRPIEHISNKFVDLSLTEVARDVLETLTPIEREVRTSDGFWYMLRCRPYRTYQNKIDGVVLTFTDVTRLKESETESSKAHRFAQSIVETVPQSLLVLRGDFTVVEANRAYYATFDTDARATVNQNLYSIGRGQWNDGELRRLLDDVLAKGSEVSNFEMEIQAAAGRSRTVLLNARRLEQIPDDSPLILLAIQDYTERKRAADLLARSEERLRQRADELEQQLIASGRLVSLGEITASMAHEFNNPLGIIIGFAEDLLSEIDSAEPHHEALTIIDSEAKRCKNIIQSLMDFARPGSAQRRPTYIGDLIAMTLKMMESRVFKQKVTLARQVQPDLPPIEADPNQIEQVLLNLYLNALDAMPNGGTLTVGGTLETIADAGEELVITIADTGKGIAEKNLTKVFQPFFTVNKSTGLGLGLPICERIVKNHGGRIEVTSESGKGATFKILLPINTARETTGSMIRDRGFELPR